MNFIGILREKKSTEKSDINLLGINFFDSRTFLIYQIVPQRNSSALWAKKISTENVIFRSYSQFFSKPHIWNFLKY